MAQACEVLDFRIVNRLLLNNCGISGDQFAEILKGLKKLRDFKSLVYIKNSINSASLTALKPLLEKRLPYHLQELKLIDCKIQAAQICQLMDDLLELSQIQKLALIGVKHNFRSFNAVIQFVESSDTLQEVDLSRSVVMKGSWLSFA